MGAHTVVRGETSGRSPPRPRVIKATDVGTYYTLFSTIHPIQVAPQADHLSGPVWDVQDGAKENRQVD
jgi:hypothetical protein